MGQGRKLWSFFWGCPRLDNLLSRGQFQAFKPIQHSSNRYQVVIQREITYPLSTYHSTSPSKIVTISEEACVARMVMRLVEFDKFLVIQVGDRSRIAAAGVLIRRSREHSLMHANVI